MFTESQPRPEGAIAVAQQHRDAAVRVGVESSVGHREVLHSIAIEVAHGDEQRSTVFTES